MTEFNTFYSADRKEWRKWLSENFNKEGEIWLIFPNKSSGKPRIAYNDAVEEALCFGWIDSIVKKLDDHHTMQRFSPRKAKSNFSQANKERIKWLAEHNLIHPPIKELVRHILEEEFIFPEDILDALRKDKVVWDNFEKFSPSYKRIRVAYIDAARTRSEEFKRRLKNFIEKTRDNKRIKGHGGIEKYY